MGFVRNEGGRSGGTSLVGVRASIRGGGGRITSSGIRDLDEILGGGYPLGSIVLLGERGGTAHSNAILNCFLAQGFAHDHAVAVACADDRPENVIRNIPARTDAAPREVLRGGTEESKDSDLRIAWRYRNQQGYSGKAGSHGGGGQPSGDARKFCHNFDLSQVDSSSMEGKKLSLLGIGNEVDLDTVASKLRVHVKGSIRAKVAARIAVRQLGSALWEGEPRTFLRKLRSLARESNTVCLITAACPDAELEHLSDVVLSLDTNNGQGTKSLGLGDYLGIVRVLKNTSPFSLHSNRQSTKMYTFWRGRRSYHIEEAHAAPEENEITNFEDGKSLACAPGPGKNPAIDY
uniref:Elongator complex protein 4 n=1 Tax=Rhodosorus marinus TaxID=101924 RepID=A0A7S2ZVB1_9RHOD|mmetsp:Transcript_33/g.76  ORF Transcript_33/g.76 Transcript_33/m.76 type:complete len:347 (+) Transcript_33:489-1529(+)